MEIKVDKEIPAPFIRIGRVPKYPWHTLKVGESFAVPEDRDMTSMRSQCSRAGKKLGMRFAVRDTGKQLRVWRVE